MRVRVRVGGDGYGWGGGPRPEARSTSSPLARQVTSYPANIRGKEAVRLTPIASRAAVATPSDMRA